MRRLTSLLSLCALAMSPSLSHAAQGIDGAAVHFGQVAALDGPAAALGQGMRLGLRAAFEEANAHGGVHGRKSFWTVSTTGMNPTALWHRSSR